MKKLSFKSVFIVLTVLLLGISNNIRAQEPQLYIPIEIKIQNYSSVDKMYIFEVQDPDLIPPYKIEHIGVVKPNPPGTISYGNIIPVYQVPVYHLASCKLRFTTTDGNSIVFSVFRHIDNLVSYGTVTIRTSGALSYRGGR